MGISVRPTKDAFLTPIGDGSFKDGVSLYTDFELTADAEDGSPILRLTFNAFGGVPECRRVELVSNGPDGREVRSSDLRRVRIEDLLETAVHQVAMVFTTTGSSEPDPKSGATMTGYIGSAPRTDRDRRQVVTGTRKARKEARRRVGPDFLADVARVYRENLDGNPTMAVADHTGRAHRTAALYVKQARDAGLLGAASPGKKGEQ